MYILYIRYFHTIAYIKCLLLDRKFVEKSTDVDRHHIGYWFVSVRIHKPHFNNLRNFAVQVFFTLPYRNQNYQNIIKEWVSLIDYLVLNYHQCYVWYMYLCFITKKYYELRPFCFDFVLKQCYTNFQNILKLHGVSILQGNWHKPCNFYWYM